MVYSASHDGSVDAASPYLFYFRSYLAPVFYRSFDFFYPMKRSVRPLFTILILAVFSSTLLCRSALRRGFHAHPSPVFNSTFLAYASIDIGEAKARQHIDQLLQGNFTTVWLSKLRRRPESRAPSPSPFSSAPLIFRSHKAYPYWLEFRRLLQEWSRKKSFQPEIMLDLVKLPLDRLNGRPSSHRRYASCAVVGNSGILINSSYGTAIDAHEVVIRLNNARLHPFERDVGSKTTISFVNSNILHLCARRQGCFCHPYGSNVPMLMYICQPVHFLDLTLCYSTAKGPLLTTDPRFDVLCARIVKYYSAKRFVEETGRPLEEWASTHEGSLFHYSSGMQAVMLAVGICDKVSIFGFGKSASAKHHYHSNQKAELSLHDYEAEYHLYRDLVESPQVIPFISDKFRFPDVQIHQ